MWAAPAVSAVRGSRVVAEAPVSALAGVTEKDAELLAQAFGIKTIHALVNNNPSKWARAIVIAANLEE